MFVHLPRSFIQAKFNPKNQGYFGSEKVSEIFSYAP